MPVIDRVKWDGRADMLAWKFPSEELSTWTQLIVSETQLAFVVKDGIYQGPFEAGRHVLETENIPLLRGLMGIPFGGKTPFSAEVWYVNLLTNLDVKWGTSDPIQLQDPAYGILVPIRAFGQYGIRIGDAKKFLLKLVGVVPSFDSSALSTFFKGVLTTKIKTSIGNAILKHGKSVLELSTELENISDLVKNSLAPEMENYGVALSQFNINSINVPEGNPAVVKLRDALAKRAEMRILGYSYQQERSFDVMEGAARNEGTAGGVIGAGIGLGMGVNVGQTIGGQMGQIVQGTGMGPQSTPPTPSPGSAAQVQTFPCNSCGNQIAAGVKFCPSCGDPVDPCPKCGADNRKGASNCSACGASLPTECMQCKAMVPPESKFCPSCGNKMTATCKSCNCDLRPGTKFCSECGAPQ